MSMLKGEQFAEVRDAIMGAFDGSQLDMMLHDRLDYVRAQHVEDGPFKVVVTNVLTDLGQKGLERQLLAAVAEERPDKEEIQTIYRKYTAKVINKGSRPIDEPPRSWSKIKVVVLAVVMAGVAFVLFQCQKPAHRTVPDPPPTTSPGFAIARFVTKLLHQPKSGVRVVMKSSDGEWLQETTSDGSGLATFNIPTTRLQEEFWLTLPDHAPRFSPESYRYIESSSSFPINVPPPPPSP